MNRAKSAKGRPRTALHHLMSAVLRTRSRAYPVASLEPVLVIAPHQDDATLGCGGLIARRRLQADPVHICYVTDGSAGLPGHPTISPEMLAVKRTAEAREATRILGVDWAELTFLGAADGTLANVTPAVSDELVRRIADLLRRLRPAAIFLPCRRDGSSEHEAAFVLVERALAVSALQARLIEYAIWAQWNPRRLVGPFFTSRRIWRTDFQGYERIKRKAIAAYDSQVNPMPPWTEPALSRQFVSFFSSAQEFYFER